MSMESFHFLRPSWLLALLLLVPLVWLGLRAGVASSAWRRVCDARLLGHLVLDGATATSRLSVAAVALGWLAACIALAGPTWERLPVPSYSEPTQTVLVLSLAPSMTTRDIEPNRLARARYKLRDALDLVEGAVGLVIYAEEPYAVTPLTDDPRVIAEQVSLLEPSLMPGRRAHLGRAIEEAHRLLTAAGASGGRILVLADGLGDAPDAALHAASVSAAAGYAVSALGFGRAAATLKDVTEAGQGRFEKMQTDDADLARLLVDADVASPFLGTLSDASVQADTWKDNGAWLLWFPLMLAPLAFRRGWASSLAVVGFVGIGLSEPATAQAEVADWWARPDQRAAQAFARGDYGAAGELFEDPDWRGAAAYRAGDYAAAAEAWQQAPDLDSQFNLGNSLAHSGRLEDSIAAYDRVLEADPQNEDARFNRDLVAKLLEEQERQEEEPQQQQQGQDQEQENQQPEAGEDSATEDSSDDTSDPNASPDPNRASEESGREEGEEQTDSPEDPSDAGDEANDSADSEAGNSTPDSGETQGAENAGEEPSDARDGQTASDPSEGVEGTPTAAGEPAEEAQEDPADSALASAPDYSESDQEAEHWLNRVPDDPGALLREKLRRRYEARRYGQRSSQGEWR